MFTYMFSVHPVQLSSQAQQGGQSVLYALGPLSILSEWAVGVAEKTCVFKRPEITVMVKSCHVCNDVFCD